MRRLKWTSPFCIIRSAIGLDLSCGTYVQGTRSHIVRLSATTDGTLSVYRQCRNVRIQSVSFLRNKRTDDFKTRCCLSIIHRQGGNSKSRNIIECKFFFGGTSDFITAKIQNNLDSSGGTAKLTIMQNTTDASVVTVKNAQRYSAVCSFGDMVPSTLLMIVRLYFFLILIVV